MKQRPSLSRFLGGLLLIAAAACLPGARGQEAQVPPGPAVSVATRVLEPAAAVGTDVDAVSSADLEREQLSSLQDALAGIPAAPNFAAGQAGAPDSIFLRGANADQTLFLVDGIRLNDANTDYGEFLGGARMFPGDTLEVARGPQGALYGSDAAGGVISLSTQKGSGPPTESLSAEAGSFDTVDGMITAQGTSGKWAYDAAAAGSSTGNDRINNAFSDDGIALRLDLNAGQYVDVGATLRGAISRYGDPGDEFVNDPISHETDDNWLGTIFANAELTQYITSRLTLGGQDRHYDALIDATQSTPLETELVDNRRGVIDWQNTIQLTAQDRLIAGVTGEEDTDHETGLANIDQRQTLFALYGEDEWNPLKGVYLTSALRRDDYGTFGAATTGRLTGALLLLDNALKLRGSYGTGFDAPSFLELYGVNGYYVGNPNLQPERSQGWDMGVDFYTPGNQGALSVTWFQTDFENLIADNFNVTPATTENVGNARTRGVEVALKTVLAAVIQTKLSYTRLEAEDLTDGTALPLRPRYELNADLWDDLGGGFSLGAGAGWVGTRADVDAQTLAPVYDPGYAVARIYAAWKISRHLTVKVRVENALNEQYEPVNGYPALGRGVFGGAEWKF